MVTFTRVRRRVRLECWSGRVVAYIDILGERIDRGLEVVGVLDELEEMFSQ